MTLARTPSQTAVLVVEDEAFLRMDAVDLIEDAGFYVYEAANAQEALEQLARHRDIEILFTDIDMPGAIDGLGLAHYVKKNWPSIKIVLTSGHYDPPLGAIPRDGRFVPKPFPAQKVTGLLKTLVAPHMTSLETPLTI